MYSRVVIFTVIGLLLLLLPPSSLLMAEKRERQEIKRIPIIPLPGFSEIERRNSEATTTAQDSAPNPTNDNENEVQTTRDIDDADSIINTEQAVTPVVPQIEQLEQPEQSERLEQAEQIEQPEQPEQLEQSEQLEQMEQPEQPATETIEWYEIGEASWYGGRFQGRETANGEIFDTNLLTAAHQTLPFDTIVRVYNPKNGKSVLVRINDRGPFVGNRIIDLSRAAAVQIDTAVAGVSEVRLEIVRLGEEPKVVKIQMGAFSEYENATDLVTDLKRDGFNPQIEAVNDSIFRVVLVDVARERSESVLQALYAKGYSNVFVRTER